MSVEIAAYCVLVIVIGLMLHRERHTMTMARRVESLMREVEIGLRLRMRCHECPLFKGARDATKRAEEISLKNHRCVLLVDDNPLLLRSTEKILRKMGFCVTSAQNGEDALAVLETSHPEVIFLDLDMPVMNGPKFARELIRRGWDDIPIVVVSGVELAADVYSLLNEILDTVVGFLTKPYDIQDLTRVLVELALPRCPEPSKL